MPQTEPFPSPLWEAFLADSTPPRHGCPALPNRGTAAALMRITYSADSQPLDYCCRIRYSNTFAAPGWFSPVAVSFRHRVEAGSLR